ncbi:MAG TPA: hypothetical protein VFV01_16950 [Spirillospora sp.]|nr:hypothetical protein [Spirillospora sp.]
MTPKKSAPSKAVAKSRLRVPSTRVDKAPSKDLAIRAEHLMGVSNPSVVLVAPDSSTVTVTDLKDFYAKVYTLGYTPQSGSIHADYLILKGAPPATDPNEVLRMTDITNSQSAARVALGAAFVAHDAQVIDLCSAPYNLSPGDDITSAMQSAINTIATSGQSGTIRISKVGAYTMNGALQTGSYTGSAGVNAGQGGGQTHTWNAQVLFPALQFTNAKVPAITIEGGVIPTRGWKFTGDAQGVTITSNITSGKMFEAVSGFDGWGQVWTGIMPVFRNLILRLPDNPTAGAIDIQHCLRAEIERVAVLTQNSWVIPTAGNNSTDVGIALPQHYENGDVLVREVDVRGYPSAFRISEHAVFSNVQIVGCNVAFISNGGGHYNFFYGVDVEEVQTVFKLETGSTIALSVYGQIDSETNDTYPTMILEDSSGAPASIIGRIDAREALGSIGQVVPLLDVTCANRGQGAGWKALHPSDDFSRSGGHGLTTGAPGHCNPSMHPWLPIQGFFTVTGGSSPSMHQTSGGNTCQAGVPVLDGKTWGRPRRISGTFVLSAAGNRSVALFANRNPDTGQGIFASCYNGNVYLKFGLYASHSGYVATAAVAEAVNGATITLDLEVHYANQRPAVVKVYLNRVLRLSYALTAADLAVLGLGAFPPYIHDGVAFSDADVTSAISGLVVREITSTQVLTSGTATLAAGTVSVADTRITASSVIRLNRQAAGGTLGEMSVALTAGTGFTINSSSNVDTSSVFYEVITY